MPNKSDLHQLQSIGISFGNIVSIEMETGPRNFELLSAFNRVCYSYYEFGKQGIELLIKILQEYDSLISAVDISARLLSANNLFDFSCEFPLNRLSAAISATATTITRYYDCKSSQGF